MSNFDLVRSAPLAAELSDEECHVLAKIISVRRLNDGETLLQEGHRDDSLYMVVGGKLAVYKQAGGGAEDILYVHKPGEISGAMGFLDGLEHSATLRAQGHVELFSLSRTKFEALIDTHPNLVYKVMRAIVRSVHLIVRRMNSSHVELTNYISKQHGRY